MSFYNRARLLSVTAFAAIWIATSAAPAGAQETTRAKDSKARSTASLNLNTAAPGATIPGTSHTGAGFMNGFVYAPGPQAVVGFHGRLNVGKTGVYVPYYGNVGIDPLHPNVQGVAGIGYGFRSWDVSVVNGGLNAGTPALNPGGDQQKPTPSLSISVRF